MVWNGDGVNIENEFSNWIDSISDDKYILVAVNGDVSIPTGSTFY